MAATPPPPAAPAAAAPWSFSARQKLSNDVSSLPPPCLNDVVQIIFGKTRENVIGDEFTVDFAKILVALGYRRGFERSLFASRGARVASGVRRFGLVAARATRGGAAGSPSPGRGRYETKPPPGPGPVRVSVRVPGQPQPGNPEPGARLGIRRLENHRRGDA